MNQYKFEPPPPLPQRKIARPLTGKQPMKMEFIDSQNQIWRLDKEFGWQYLYSVYKEGQLRLYPISAFVNGKKRYMELKDLLKLKT